jgi:hypothetical protein
MKTLEQILRQDDLELWTKYLEQQSLGLKKPANEYLEQFIHNLSNYSTQELDQIVLALCQLRATDNIKINHKLFLKAIYPNLLTNSLNEIPDYHRLLATYEQSIYSDNRLNKEISEKLDLETEYFDTIEVLERELRIGKNLEAAKLLINKIAWQLDYALHELPIGMLYETELMARLLSRMVDLLKEYEALTTIWQQRIEFIETAIKHWKKYLSTSQYENFEQYLKDVNSSETQLLIEWNAVLYDLEE